MIPKKELFNKCLLKKYEFISIHNFFILLKICGQFYFHFEAALTWANLINWGLFDWGCFNLQMIWLEILSQLYTSCLIIKQCFLKCLTPDKVHFDYMMIKSTLYWTNKLIRIFYSVTCSYLKQRSMWSTCHFTCTHYSDPNQPDFAVSP